MAKRAIYKYVVQTREPTMIPGGIYAHFLSAQMQRDSLCVWVAVDPGAAEEPVWLSTVGTGVIYDNGSDDKPVIFIDTVQAGPLVWHVFAQPA